MAFDFSTLITDRSPEDLQALRDLLATPMADWTAEQLAEFNRAASKGAYNYTDLNRVVAAMDDINERLTAAGYVTGYQRIEVPHHEGGNSRLPSGYTELQYIDSSGTQYIDTGVKPNQDTQVTARLMLLGSTIAYLFGAHGGSGEGYNNRYGILYTSDHLFRSDYNTGNGPTFSSDLKLNVAYTIDKDKNVCSMGDFTVTSPEGVFQSPYNMFIGCVNEGGSPAYYASMRIYAFSVAENDELVREYFPCISPSGEIGLYDLQAGEFFNNVGSGKFVAGPPLNPLPSKYKQLEYIQSTGTQRIDTGIKPGGNTRVTVDIRISDAQTTGGHLFSVTGNKYFVVSFNPQLAAWWRTRHGSSALTSFPASANTRGRCIVDKNQNITTVNEEIVTLPEADFSLNYNMNLFCRNASGQFNAFLSAKLYSCRIYQAGKLVRNFVPCLSPAGDVGLYDLCEDKFYGNSGTGVFIGGPEIVTPDPEPPDPELPSDPYTWYESDVPTSSLLSAYLANVGNLKSTLTLPTSIPAVPDDMEGLTQTEANNIEKILEITNEYLVSLQKIFLRCGHAICGNNFYFVN